VTFVAGRDTERGGVTVWILVMFSVLVMFMSVSYDAGRVIAAHREADNIAGTAARAAAQRIEESSVYARDELGRVAINEDDAIEIATELITRQGAEVVAISQCNSGR